MSLHTENPPLDIIRNWLSEMPTVVGNYGHILLEQKKPGDDAVRNGLTPYFESAHADARQNFHRFARISLHPDAGEEGCDAAYPNCLPKTARHGLFGEVMAGLLTEALEMVGKRGWIVPVFLFRKHEDVQQYIYNLSRDPTKKRQVLGRKGDDFIGIAIGDDGSLTSVIAGEAKWRKTWNKSTLDTVMLGDLVVDPKTGKKVRKRNGVWAGINSALNSPIGLAQLQQILIELAPNGYANVILSIDRILALKNPDSIERTDLILLSGGGAAKRDSGDTLIGWEELPVEYTAGRNLQVVELIIEDGEDLIQALYDLLWKGENNA